jgi:hypothetical protein
VVKKVEIYKNHLKAINYLNLLKEVPNYFLHMAHKAEKCQYKCHYKGQLVNLNNQTHYFSLLVDEVIF